MIDDADRRARVVTALRDRWPDDDKSPANGSSAPREKQDTAAKLRRLAEQAPGELRGRVLMAAEAGEEGRTPGEAFPQLAEDLPAVWLGAMRGVGKTVQFLPSDFIPDELVELTAIEHPESVELLIQAKQTLENLAAVLEKDRITARATRLLVDCLPTQLRVQVVRKTLAATQTVGGGSAHAAAFVGLVRCVPDEIQAEVIKEALARLQALEERKAPGGYEENMLELVYQVPPEYLSDVLAVLRADPDPWIRARILDYSSGVLLDFVQKEALLILSEVDDNALGVALRLVPILDDVLKPQGLSRVRKLANERDRARMLSDLTVCLPEKLRDDVAGEAIAIARRLSEDQREWTLRDLAARLPVEARPEVLSAAREIADVSLRAATLSGIASYFPNGLRTEILREALGLLPEVPEPWRRANVIEKVAHDLPEALQEEALAVAREIPEGISRATALCQLAVGMRAEEQSDLYDEAATTLRHIEDERKRIVELANICRYLPTQRRASIAKEAWETMQELPLPKQQEPNYTRWRINTLTTLVTHLADALAEEAAQEAISMLEGLPDDERQRKAYALEHALSNRSQASADEEARVSPPRNRSEPHTRFQREQNAALLLKQMHEQSEKRKIGQIEEVFEAIESAGFSDRSRPLRQLVRCLPDELPGELAAAKLTNVAESVGSRSLFQELSEHLTGTEKTRILCQALTAGKHAPGKITFEQMVAQWQMKNFHLDVGRDLLPSLLPDLASHERPHLMGELSAVMPIIAHLFGRRVGDEVFRALRDITRWWP